MFGKCPKCGNEVRTVNITAVKAFDIRRELKAVTYNCPHSSCRAVLSVELDHVTAEDLATGERRRIGLNP